MKDTFCSTIRLDGGAAPKPPLLAAGAFGGNYKSACLWQVGKKFAVTSTFFLAGLHARNLWPLPQSC